MLCVLYCNNLPGLYDFYYMLVTLTTGYNIQTYLPLVVTSPLPHYPPPLEGHNTNKINTRTLQRVHVHVCIRTVYCMC